jgi:hypothetical protein
LVIYRFGMLAELAKDADAALTRPKGQALIAGFHAHRKAILARREYKAAIACIRQRATELFGDAAYKNKELLEDVAANDLLEGQAHELGRDVFLMPPQLSKREREAIGPSIHLVGILPAERMQCTIDKTRWAIRIRASVTACALEMANTYPKLWWTFEAVPVHPEKDDQLSERGVREFFAYISDIEPTITESLSDAYFAALGEIVNMDKTPPHTLGSERLRLSFADSNATSISELIDALHNHSLTANDIKASRSKILAPAKEGIEVYERFLRAANAAFVPPVLPEFATSDLGDLDVDLQGVEAVASRAHDDSLEATAIAGIAQRPSLITPWDEYGSNKRLTMAENVEPSVRNRSASRRVTRELAGREAIKLELRRRAVRRTGIAPAS